MPSPNFSVQRHWRRKFLNFLRHGPWRPSGESPALPPGPGAVKGGIEAKSQNPWTGVLGGLVGISLSTLLALRWGKTDFWGSQFDRSGLMWFLPLLTFATMAFIDLVIDGSLWKTPSRLAPYHRNLSSLWRAALWRYAALVLFWGGLRFLYLNHPLYLGSFYQPFREIVPVLFWSFVVVGLPYGVLTLRHRGSIRADLKDPGLHLLLWLRWPWKVLFDKHSGSAATVWRNRRTKIVGLGFIVEAFFFPVMAVFFANNFRDFASQLSHTLLTPSQGFAYHESLYRTVYHGLYLTDVLLVLGGYALPLRWLSNKIESVEPTLFGWLVTLLCYPPFNQLANLWLPFGNGSDVPWITTLWVREGLMLLTLFFVAVYVGATMMFGTRFSNLTHRGILTRGVYGVVRHPAYAAKNLSWWLENLPWLNHPLQFLFLAGWNVIYALRAITEERHLSKDPAYRAYCRQVRYRYVPGIF